jgi:hypothetical protein
MDRKEAEERLAASVLPDRAQEAACIQNVFGSIADKLLVEQAPFLDLDLQAYQKLKDRILNHWEDIESLTRLVPAPGQMAALLQRAGGATRPADLRLSGEEVRQALQYSHFLRNRFTVRKLSRILGLEPQSLCNEGGLPVF